MINYKSIVKNVNFVLNNLNYLQYDTVIEFNSYVNYFVDQVILEKFDKKINKL